VSISEEDRLENHPHVQSITNYFKKQDLSPERALQILATLSGVLISNPMKIVNGKPVLDSKNIRKISEQSKKYGEMVSEIVREVVQINNSDGSFNFDLN